MANDDAVEFGTDTKGVSCRQYVALRNCRRLSMANDASAFSRLRMARRKPDNARWRNFFLTTVAKTIIVKDRTGPKAVTVTGCPVSTKKECVQPSGLLLREPKK